MINAVVPSKRPSQALMALQSEGTVVKALRFVARTVGKIFQACRRAIAREPTDEEKIDIRTW
jgi:hypothetical protein